MGCICSKGASGKENFIKEKESRNSSKRLTSSRKDEIVAEVDCGGNDATARLISTEVSGKSAGSTPTGWDEEENRAVAFERPRAPQRQRHTSTNSGVSGGQPQLCRVFSVQNGVDGTQVVAGWPSWLSAVAGEAIRGWVPRKADSFEKLDKIGQGTYSSVYRARDLETGKIVALKKVRFVNMDPESVRFMAREILILRRLDHPNVMKLEGLVTSRVSGNLYLVFEYMEHDLAGLAASPPIKFTEAQIKCHMQQLLCGLEHCHSRGVLHRDIKGSNLLIDNNGTLKIGDFGLATVFSASQKKPLTSRVVTLWYRPPELLLGATDYGASVDLWSTGCILAELFAGKPIMPGRTEVEQLHKIFKLCGSPSEEYWKRSKLPHATIFKPQQPYNRCVAEAFKDFPPSTLRLLDALLAVEPEHRGSASSALQNEFFTTKPLPCDPSSLPKYPPSKELDAKIRQEEARRQRGDSDKGREPHRKGSREVKALSAVDANAELQVSTQVYQKHQTQSNGKTRSGMNIPAASGGSGLPIEPSGEPSRGLLQNGEFHGRSSEAGSPTISQRAFDSSRNSAELKTLRAYKPQGAAQLSMFSSSVADRGSSHFDFSRGSNWADGHLNTRYNQLHDAKSSHHQLNRPNSSYKKDEPAPGKRSTMGYSSKANRIHYSGPLIPPGGNIEEMLKEHERRIERAVRKARVDKTKVRNAYIDNGQTELLLHYG